MENFEKQALDMAPKRANLLVEDTFITRLHVIEELQEFQHLNSIHANIRFIMKKEKDTHYHIQFLDMLVTKKSNGTLRHTVYRKLTIWFCIYKQSHTITLRKNVQF
jgi:hypothetical protein